MDERKTRIYEISAYDRVLDELERIFSRMQYLGNIGSSRYIAVYCDGDGGARIKVIKKNKELKKFNKSHYIKEPIVISYTGDTKFYLG